VLKAGERGGAVNPPVFSRLDCRHQPGVAHHVSRATKMRGSWLILGKLRCPTKFNRQIQIGICTSE